MLQHVTNAGVEIHFATFGSSDNHVVLIHGWAGSRLSWDRGGFIQELQSDPVSVIAIDLRGRGTSGKPILASQYRMSDYVSDVVAVLDHIESKGAVLVGFSTGGDISLELARLHPDRVLGVVGIAATAKQYKISGEELAYQVVNLQTDGILPFVAALERNWVLPPWMKDILVQNDPLALSAARIGWQVWDGLDGKLNEIDVPCLFIAGERDDLIEDVRTTAEQIKESTLIELKQCDHIQTFLELDRVVEQLRDFMRLCFGRTVGG